MAIGKKQIRFGIIILAVVSFYVFFGGIFIGGIIFAAVKVGGDTGPFIFFVAVALVIVFFALVTYAALEYMMCKKKEYDQLVDTFLGVVFVFVYLGLYFGVVAIFRNPAVKAIAADDPRADEKKANRMVMSFFIYLTQSFIAVIVPIFQVLYMHFRVKKRLNQKGPFIGYFLMAALIAIHAITGMVFWKRDVLVVYALNSDLFSLASNICLPILFSVALLLSSVSGVGFFIFSVVILIAWTTFVIIVDCTGNGDVSTSYGLLLIVYAVVPHFFKVKHLAESVLVNSSQTLVTLSIIIYLAFRRGFGITSFAFFHPFLTIDGGDILALFVACCFFLPLLLRKRNFTFPINLCILCFFVGSTVFSWIVSLCFVAISLMSICMAQKNLSLTEIYENLDSARILDEEEDKKKDDPKEDKDEEEDPGDLPSLPDLPQSPGDLPPLPQESEEQKGEDESPAFELSAADDDEEEQKLDGIERRMYKWIIDALLSVFGDKRSRSWKHVVWKLTARSFYFLVYFFCCIVMIVKSWWPMEPEKTYFFHFINLFFLFLLGVCVNMNWFECLLPIDWKKVISLFRKKDDEEENEEEGEDAVQPLSKSTIIEYFTRFKPLVFLLPFSVVFFASNVMFGGSISGDSLSVLRIVYAVVFCVLLLAVNVQYNLVSFANMNLLDILLFQVLRAVLVSGCFYFLFQLIDIPYYASNWTMMVFCIILFGLLFRFQSYFSLFKVNKKRIYIPRLLSLPMLCVFAFFSVAFIWNVNSSYFLQTLLFVVVIIEVFMEREEWKMASFLIANIFAGAVMGFEYYFYFLRSSPYQFGDLAVSLLNFDLKYVLYVILAFVASIVHVDFSVVDSFLKTKIFKQEKSESTTDDEEKRWIKLSNPMQKDWNFVFFLINLIFLSLFSSHLYVFLIVAVVMFLVSFLIKKGGTNAKLLMISLFPILIGVRLTLDIVLSWALGSEYFFTFSYISVCFVILFFWISVSSVGFVKTKFLSLEESFKTVFDDGVSKSHECSFFGKSIVSLIFRISCVLSSIYCVCLTCFFFFFDTGTAKHDYYYRFSLAFFVAVVVVISRVVQFFFDARILKTEMGDEDIEIQVSDDEDEEILEDSQPEEEEISLEQPSQSDYSFPGITDGEECVATLSKTHLKVNVPSVAFTHTIPIAEVIKLKKMEKNGLKYLLFLCKDQHFELIIPEELMPEFQKAFLKCVGKEKEEEKTSAVTTSVLKKRLENVYKPLPELSASWSIGYDLYLGLSVLCILLLCSPLATEKRADWMFLFVVVLSWGLGFRHKLAYNYNLFGYDWNTVLRGELMPLTLKLTTVVPLIGLFVFQILAFFWPAISFRFIDYYNVIFLFLILDLLFSSKKSKLLGFLVNGIFIALFVILENVMLNFCAGGELCNIKSYYGIAKTVKPYGLENPEGEIRQWILDGKLIIYFVISTIILFFDISFFNKGKKFVKVGFCKPKDHGNYIFFYLSSVIFCFITSKYLLAFCVVSAIMYLSIFVYPMKTQNRLLAYAILGWIVILRVSINYVSSTISDAVNPTVSKRTFNYAYVTLGIIFFCVWLFVSSTPSVQKRYLGAANLVESMFPSDGFDCNGSMRWIVVFFHFTKIVMLIYLAGFGALSFLIHNFSDLLIHWSPAIVAIAPVLFLVYRIVLIVLFYVDPKVKESKEKDVKQADEKKEDKEVVVVEEEEEEKVEKKEEEGDGDAVAYSAESQSPGVVTAEEQQQPQENPELDGRSSFIENEEGIEQPAKEMKEEKKKRKTFQPFFVKLGMILCGGYEQFDLELISLACYVCSVFTFISYFVNLSSDGFSRFGEVSQLIFGCVMITFYVLFFQIDYKFLKWHIPKIFRPSLLATVVCMYIITFATGAYRFYNVLVVIVIVEVNTSFRFRFLNFFFGTLILIPFIIAEKISYVTVGSGTQAPSYYGSYFREFVLEKVLSLDVKMVVYTILCFLPTWFYSIKGLPYIRFYKGLLGGKMARVKPILCVFILTAISYCTSVYYVSLLFHGILIYVVCLAFEFKPSTKSFVLAITPFALGSRFLLEISLRAFLLDEDGERLHSYTGWIFRTYVIGMCLVFLFHLVITAVPWFEKRLCINQGKQKVCQIITDLFSKSENDGTKKKKSFLRAELMFEISRSIVALLAVIGAFFIVWDAGVVDNEAMQFRSYFALGIAVAYLLFVLLLRGDLLFLFMFPGLLLVLLFFVFGSYPWDWPVNERKMNKIIVFSVEIGVCLIVFIILRFTNLFTFSISNEHCRVGFPSKKKSTTWKTVYILLRELYWMFCLGVALAFSISVPEVYGIPSMVFVVLAVVRGIWDGEQYQFFVSVFYSSLEFIFLVRMERDFIKFYYLVPLSLLVVLLFVIVTATNLSKVERKQEKKNVSKKLTKAKKIVGIVTQFLGTVMLFSVPFTLFVNRDFFIPFIILLNLNGFWMTSTTGTYTFLLLLPFSFFGFLFAVLFDYLKENWFFPVVFNGVWVYTLVIYVLVQSGVIFMFSSLRSRRLFLFPLYYVVKRFYKLLHVVGVIGRFFSHLEPYSLCSKSFYESLKAVEDEEEDEEIIELEEEEGEIEQQENKTQIQYFDKVNDVKSYFSELFGELKNNVVLSFSSPTCKNLCVILLAELCLISCGCGFMGASIISFALAMLYVPWSGAYPLYVILPLIACGASGGSNLLYDHFMGLYSTRRPMYFLSFGLPLIILSLLGIAVVYIKQIDEHRGTFNFLRKFLKKKEDSHENRDNEEHTENFFLILSVILSETSINDLRTLLRKLDIVKILTNWVSKFKEKGKRGNFLFWIEEVPKIVLLWYLSFSILLLTFTVSIPTWDFTTAWFMLSIALCGVFEIGISFALPELKKWRKVFGMVRIGLSVLPLVMVVGVDKLSSSYFITLPISLIVFSAYFVLVGIICTFWLSSWYKEYSKEKEENAKKREEELKIQKKKEKEKKKKEKEKEIVGIPIERETIVIDPKQQTQVVKEEVLGVLCRVRALHSFSAKQSGVMSFEAGTCMSVFQRREGWFVGKIEKDGKLQGDSPLLIPSNFVEVIETFEVEVPKPPEIEKEMEEETVTITVPENQVKKTTTEESASPVSSMKKESIQRHMVQLPEEGGLTGKETVHELAFRISQQRQKFVTSYTSMGQVLKNLDSERAAAEKKIKELSARIQQNLKERTNWVKSMNAIAEVTIPAMDGMLMKVRQGESVKMDLLKKMAVHQPPKMQ